MTPVRSQPANSFFREVWRIERQIHSDRSSWRRVGHDGWPAQELVRFRTSQHMGFAGQDVVDARIERNDKGMLSADLTVDCLGLTGARGALPAHYTEMVLAQLKSRAPALRDFLDLFNHRLLSLFYRSWEKTQPAVHQERAEDDLFTQILRALTNCEEDWEIYYGAALARGTRSEATIRGVLGDLTGMPVDVRALQGGWQAVPDQDQSRLPSRSNPKGQYARLGEVMLGSRVWMADKGAEIVFRPKNNEQLASILPKGRFSKAIGQLTGRLVGSQVEVRYCALTSASGLTGARLGRNGRLGEDSFISTQGSSDKTVEVSFKPGKG